MKWTEIRTPSADACWGVRVGGDSFVIAYIRGIGFTATHKSINDMAAPALFLGDGADEPFSSFDEARASCEEFLAKKKRSLQ